MSKDQSPERVAATLGSVVRPLPCPFCGEKVVYTWPIFEGGRKGFRTGCLSFACALTPFTRNNWSTANEAVAAWNRRPNPVAQREPAKDQV